ncbi:MAG: Xaa-Pro dipeptidase, partial [Pseudomonadales bacterium]|nr:Xaa-Pro dipeptidase [Pseudomonadales bacterium]
DDQPPPFRLNPHFAQWISDVGFQHSVLTIKPGKRPQLMLYRPNDYWHASKSLPSEVQNNFDIEVFEDLTKLSKATNALQATINRSACIGEQGSMPSEPGADQSLAEVNPSSLLDYLHFQRAYKTEYEIDALKTAASKAVLGHQAAAQAFYAGSSEFEIHMAYLKASKQTEPELPYGNIIALNEHAAILHYQHYDLDKPQPARSFLIDAGARHSGYAADITRTYAATSTTGADDEFASLIKALDESQQELISRVKPGINYYDLHVQMHRLIATILIDFDLINCSEEEAFDFEITDVFFPHGAGHLIGLQTHDVGGLLGASPTFVNSAPKRFPSLRLTRDIEEKQVFTIEPGIYFIPMLLDAFRSTKHTNKINWSKVDQFLPYGGIRIEDNVLVSKTGCENLTRNAFASLSA